MREHGLQCSRLQHRSRLPSAPGDAATISRRAFLRELNQVLPEALDEMTKGAGDDHSPVAPVDLSQAIIGPGMAVFSKYAAVLEADGTPMSVRDRASAHQSLPRRRRFRPRHAVLPALVRAARLEGRQVRRCRHAGARQGHERRRREAGRRSVRRRRHRPAAEVVGVPDGLGPGDRSAPAGLGGPAPAHPRLQDRRRERCGRGARRDSEQRPRRRGSSPIASTRSVSGQAGRRMPAPTTRSSRAGAPSSPPPLRRRRRSRRRCLDRKEDEPHEALERDRCSASRTFWKGRSSSRSSPPTSRP